MVEERKGLDANLEKLQMEFDALELIGLFKASQAIKFPHINISETASGTLEQLLQSSNRIWILQRNAVQWKLLLGKCRVELQPRLRALDLNSTNEFKCDSHIGNLNQLRTWLGRIVNSLYVTGEINLKRKAFLLRLLGQAKSEKDLRIAMLRAGLVILSSLVLKDGEKTHEFAAPMLSKIEELRQQRRQPEL